MLMKLVTVMSLGALMLAPVLSSSEALAQAQAARPGYAGSAPSSVAGCPALVWRLARDGNNVNGISYYADLSGLSKVTGTVDKTGKFILTLTSTMGNGPVATVTGQREALAANDWASKQAQGALEADMKGQGCANMHLNLKPVLDLNTFGVGG
jgi:hypothetical protein